MSKLIKLRKGLDIKIIGSAAKKVESALPIRTYALKPIDFVGLAPIPKMNVAIGDQVLAGDPIFHDKSRPDIPFCSPVSGEVIEVRRGAKRSISEILITADQEIRYREFPKEDVLSLGRDQIIERLKDSGAWPFIRQRPFNTIARPEDLPKAIVVSSFDSAPLAPDYNFIFAGKKQAFQNGLNVLTQLSGGKVHLNLDARHKPVDTFNEAQNVQINWFDGPHPSGCIGVQMHHIDPINKGDVIWHVRAQDVLTLGKLFSEGKFDPSRVVAIAGPEVTKPRYFESRLGASVEPYLRDNLENDHVRVISGNVLTGSHIDRNGFVGFFDDLVSVIAEGDEPELFGWLLPSYPRPSGGGSFTPIINDIPQEGYRVTTNTHGEERAFVMSGQYEKVLPMDIFPVHLLKAILARDFELMEGLGIYEVDTEDLALCEFVCSSKVDVQSILREGLEYVRSQS
jgi:Na+-transporting NADH:ubiquinone oxidoreductase subunit A